MYFILSRAKNQLKALTISVKFNKFIKFYERWENNSLKVCKTNKNAPSAIKNIDIWLTGSAGSNQSLRKSRQIAFLFGSFIDDVPKSNKRC